VQRKLGSEDLGEPLVNIKREVDDENLDIDNGIGRMSTSMALGIKTMTNNTIGNNADGLDCVVCGDRATGKKRNNNKNCLIKNVFVQENIMELYHAMDVKDFFDEVFERIQFMNVDIRIIVQSIKINVINVDIVDGSMF
jgi:hypothetical protein